jgi:hypothetical protein
MIGGRGRDVSHLDKPWPARALRRPDEVLRNGLWHLDFLRSASPGTHTCARGIVVGDTSV